MDLDQSTKKFVTQKEKIEDNLSYLTNKPYVPLLLMDRNYLYNEEYNKKYFLDCIDIVEKSTKNLKTKCYFEKFGKFGKFIFNF